MKNKLTITKAFIVTAVNRVKVEPKVKEPLNKSSVERSAGKIELARTALRQRSGTIAPNHKPVTCVTNAGHAPRIYAPALHTAHATNFSLAYEALACNAGSVGSYGN